jgi:hypothetical protein
MVGYTQFSNLAWVYLEDSYVLDIVEKPDTVAFKLDAVLTPADPNYHDPKAGEYYCYAKGTLLFSKVLKVEWESDKRSSARTADPSGEVDMGNIDLLTLEKGSFVVEGDWGRVRIYTPSEPRFQHSDR